jgi:hypothetical protein
MPDDRLRRSQEQEQRVARIVNGKVNPGSGSSWRRPNDVRDSEKLWEMKRTDSKSITVKLSDLEAVRRRAILDGKSSVMHLEFGKRRYVVISEDDYLALLEELDEAQLRSIEARNPGIDMEEVKRLRGSHDPA